MHEKRKLLESRTNYHSLLLIATLLSLIGLRLLKLKALLREVLTSLLAYLSSLAA